MRRVRQGTRSRARAPSRLEVVPWGGCPACWWCANPSPPDAPLGILRELPEGTATTFALDPLFPGRGKGAPGGTSREGGLVSTGKSGAGAFGPPRVGGGQDDFTGSQQAGAGRPRGRAPATPAPPGHDGGPPL